MKISSFDFTGNSLDLLDLFRDEPNVFFLDSSQHDPHRGRYSFIGFDPFDVLVHKGKDALSLLKKKFAGYAGDNVKEFSSPSSPLTAGMVGCLGYDYGLYQEKIRLRAYDDLNLPDCFFGFYDCILTVDHFTQKLTVTSSGLPEKDQYLKEKKASQRQSDVLKKLAPYLNGTLKGERDPSTRATDLSSWASLGIPPHPAKGGVRLHVLDPLGSLPVTLNGNFSKDRYMAAVDKALEYISCGDIYQVSLSQRFQFDLDEQAFDPLLFYRALRNLSPSPFGGYMDCGEFQVISNSPERFLHLNNRVVQTRPMKGTRPRGSNGLQDRALRGEILNSAKEKAELLMITDLLRNDLGRVCDYGSVSVKEMRTIEEYRYVFQATSTIEGTLRKDKDCFDLIQACFPGGSVTGCPKIRAMEIIGELEPTCRAMYTGSLGYINFAGNMDLNILIRTLLAYRDKLYFQVGGGIVADSTPENEYNETLVKARAMQACLEHVFSKILPGHKVIVEKIM